MKQKQLIAKMYKRVIKRGHRHVVICWGKVGLSHPMPRSSSTSPHPQWPSTRRNGPPPPYMDTYRQVEAGWGFLILCPRSSTSPRSNLGNYFSSPTIARRILLCWLALLTTPYHLSFPRPLLLLALFIPPREAKHIDSIEEEKKEYTEQAN